MSKIVIFTLLFSFKTFAGALPSPETPTLIIPAAVDPKTIQLSWVEHSKNVLGFVIYRDIGIGWQEIGRSPADENYYLDTTRHDLTFANYAVTAITPTGQTSKEDAMVENVLTPGGTYRIAGSVSDSAHHALSGIKVNLQKAVVEDHVEKSEDLPFLPSHRATDVLFVVDREDPIANIAVHFNIKFGYDGGVVVSLIAPDYTEVILFNGTYYGNGVEATYPYTTAPAQPLNILYGKKASGTWTLRFNNTNDEDITTIGDMSLSVGFWDSQKQTVTTDKDGTFNFTEPYGTYRLVPDLAGTAPHDLFLENDHLQENFVKP